MIRINLLAVERERAKRRVTLQPGQNVALFCSLILIGTALFVGWWYRTLSKESARLDADVAAARGQTENLRSVLQQVDQFERQRTQLQQRVALIEELRKGQSAPVRMLDVISRSVPDLLWLAELRQEGANLTVDGRAMSLAALSDFVANLEASGYFRKPVEILDSQVEPQPQGDLVRFSVRAQFSPPGT